MSSYLATIHWQRDRQRFTDNKYSRRHFWHFDGGLEIPASASPREIPTPYSDSKAVDPEEAYIASISSCHMLWFLSLAARQEYIVDDYTDRAEGFMQKNEDGFKAITHIILHPNVIFCKNKAINKQKFDKLHKQAHNMCFIAHSVKTQITVDATLSIQK